MLSFHRFQTLFLLCTTLGLSLGSPVTNAGIYFDIAPAQIEIATDAASTKPMVLDFRLGYALENHQLEVSVMSSIKDDTLNQLTTDIPSITSIFYRYIPYPHDRLKLHLILGGSRIETEARYTGSENSIEQFDGIAAGIGLEEGFEFLPELKLKAEYIRLYSGNMLNINAFVFGVRYAF